MAKVLHETSGLMFGKFKPGFTILEIMIVIAIIGLTLAVVIPRMSRNDNKQFDELVSGFQAVVQFGYTNALTTRALHRIFFDIPHHKIRLEKSTGKANAQNKLDFEPVQLSNVKTEIPLEERFEVRHFVIQGKDEMAKAVGATTNEMWFFIMPEGLVQEVSLVIYDEETNRQKTLTINPFTAQFTVE